MAALVIVSACGPKNDDSVEIAEEQNAERFKGTEVKGDAKFAVEAAESGMLQVTMAELAMKNSSSSTVKNLAETLKTDYKQINAELSSLAMEKNISLPGSISDKHRGKYEDLAKKTGEDFDKAYCDFVVSNHKDNIKAFKKEAEKGDDQAIRTWAANKVSTLEGHLANAESMENLISER